MHRSVLAVSALVCLCLSAASGAQTLTTLANFDGTNGSLLRGDLYRDSSGTFFGTTNQGGASNRGTVFSLTNDGTLSTVATFAGANGANPFGGLIADSMGTLYGTTQGGGTSGNGTVFSLNRSGTLTTLANFNSTNGRIAYGDLLYDGSGTFYGTTAFGGTSDRGTIFSMNSSGALTTLVNFNGGAQGGNPFGSLIADSSGTLYGMTNVGGAENRGTVFSLTTSGTLTTLASFNFFNGDRPIGGLLLDDSGTLFGMTQFGGSFLERGAIFSLPSTGGALTPLVIFNGSNGSLPLGDLIADANGVLYGTTGSGGRFGQGTVFSVTKTGALTTLVDFPADGSLGGGPSGTLFADENGTLFGTTSGGGTGSPALGTVFSLTGTGFAAPAPRMSNTVPEPGTWAMLIFGFGLVGAASRRRRALAA